MNILKPCPTCRYAEPVLDMHHVWLRKGTTLSLSVQAYVVCPRCSGMLKYDRPSFFQGYVNGETDKQMLVNAAYDRAFAQIKDVWNNLRR